MVADDERNGFAKRLNRACDMAGIQGGRGRRAELARIFDVSGESARKWLSGEAIPKSSRLMQIALRLGVNMEWLLTGKGEPRDGHWVRDGDGGHYGADVSSGPAVRAWIPLISWVQAGDWSEAVDHLEPGDAEEWLPSPVAVGRHAFALRVEGDSMTSPYPGKSYPPGTIIYVDPEAAPTSGKAVVAKLTDSNEVTFKIYVEEPNGRRFLRPLNPQYPVIEVDENCEIIGVVVGSWHPE